jgi:AcrR family transcriptional regulator
MGRTRAGILEATGRAVEKYGVRRATMGDVASVAGIAKGTLYNHFRTKGDLLTAAICAGVDALADGCVVLATSGGVDGLAQALRLAAETLSAHPALVRVAAEEPAELVRLLLPSYDGGWPVARAAISRVLLAAEPRLVTAPSDPEQSPVEAVGAATADAPVAFTVDPASVDPAGVRSSAAGLAAPVSTPDLPPPAPVADSAAVETVLRWLVSFAGSPGVPGEAEAGARLLAYALVVPVQ